MVRASISKRLAILGCGLLLAASGCGGNAAYEGTEQQTAEAQQKARIAAYGPKGDPAAAVKKTSGKASLGKEAMARRGGH